MVQLQNGSVDLKMGAKSVEDDERTGYPVAANSEKEFGIRTNRD